MGILKSNLNTRKVEKKLILEARHFHYFQFIFHSKHVNFFRIVRTVFEDEIHINFQVDQICAQNGHCSCSIDRKSLK